MTAGLPLVKSVLKRLGKIVLSPYGLSAAMSATDAAIFKKIMDQEDIMTIDKSKLLIKIIRETIKNKARLKSRISFNVIRNISC